MPVRHLLCPHLYASRKVCHLQMEMKCLRSWILRQRTRLQHPGSHPPLPAARGIRVLSLSGEDRHGLRLSPEHNWYCCEMPHLLQLQKWPFRDCPEYQDLFRALHGRHLFWCSGWEFILLPRHASWISGRVSACNLTGPCRLCTQGHRAWWLYDLECTIYMVRSSSVSY